MTGLPTYDVGTKSMLYSTPPPITATSPQRPLSSVPKVAVVERFKCIIIIIIIIIIVIIIITIVIEKMLNIGSDC